VFREGEWLAADRTASSSCPRRRRGDVSGGAAPGPAGARARRPAPRSSRAPGRRPARRALPLPGADLLRGVRAALPLTGPAPPRSPRRRRDRQAADRPDRAAPQAHDPTYRRA
jgi:hypothetical protein